METGPTEVPDGLANGTTGGVGTEEGLLPMSALEGNADSVLGGLGVLGFASDVALDSLSESWGLHN